MEFSQCDDRSVDQQFNFSGDQCGFSEVAFKRKRRTVELIKNDVIAPPRQRNQANARERDRTHRFNYCEEIATPQYNDVSKRNKGVNTAFTILRTLIPTEPKDRKLSKIETLRLASSYISHLGTQLLTGPVEQPCLQLLKTTNGNNNSDYNRSQVCTFCMAVKKSSKMFHTEDNFANSNTDHQFYFDPSSNAIVLSDNNPKFSHSYLI